MTAMTALKIAMVASEMAPFAKTGGLADVTSALSAALHRAGHDCRVFIPLYRRIRESGVPLTPVDFVRDATLQIGPWSLSWSLVTTTAPETRGTDAPQPIYFIDCPALFDREDIYTSDADEHVRFLGLQRAAIESCQRMGFGPDVFHLNDWQTGLIPLMLELTYGWDELFRHTRTVLTIHNIGYQGTFASDILPDTGLQAHPGRFYHQDLERGVVNFLKTGILYADAITTVSETYAREIQTERYGAGLHPLLRERRDHLVGIVNGVDYETWNPETDPQIPHHYTRDDLSGKAQNKRVLVESMGLPFRERTPLFGVVSRLAYQKGFDLFFDTLPSFLGANDAQLVVLGSGEPKYAGFFTRLQQTFPTQVSFYNGYSDKLAHLVEAGADLFLMPSRYEPCGLNQMYSLRYGTIPIVRKTGGLADTVELFNKVTGEGTGVVFDHFSTDAFRWSLAYALDLYHDEDAWRTVTRNAMARDFSWGRQSERYAALFRHVARRG